MPIHATYSKKKSLITQVHEDPSACFLGKEASQLQNCLCLLIDLFSFSYVSLPQLEFNNVVTV